MADQNDDITMEAEMMNEMAPAEMTEAEAKEMATNLAAEAPATDNNMAEGEPAVVPRLIITKMELINFKSYAGTKTIGPFHKRFSSVVGPNGSGKSNVIDAMLFVFGKRAKKLRLNKVSELIHSSDAYTGTNALDFARVNVHFAEIIDNETEDDFDIIEGTEVTISRIARRDNSSNYLIDGKNATFKKVAEYLDGKGIDLDNNRFLILQGEVEMISMMPPKGKGNDDDGLLEYLEDIIGSNKYVEDTNAAAEKVEQLSEVRQEKLNRVKAAEKEVAALSGAKSEAMGLVNKDREIRRKKNVYYQIQMMGGRKEGEGAVEEKAELVAKLEENKTQLAEADARVAEIEEGFADQRAEYDAVHDELIKTKEEYTKFERQEIQMKENIKFEKSNVKKLEQKVVAETKKGEDADVALAEAEESISTLEEKIEECTEKKEQEDAKLEEIFEETKEVTEQLRKELEIKTQRLAPLLQERSVFQNSLDTAQMEVNLLEDGVSRAKEQLENAERELASLDERQSDKKKELKDCEKELAESKQRVEVAEVEAKELEAREGVLAKKSSELLTQAEVAKASIQSTQGRSRTVSAILQAAKKNGELSKCGVLGRLGDLATIDEKYDVAVSTACGMLDHIVVQTTAGTQKCLEFLRKNNLGRASFVPLEKMKKGAHDRSVETPENAPRLFDLISPANFHIAPALFLAVGNTLVAPDLETATRWAYEYGKRWRVVTLDGKLIESSGTMSGGGKSVSRGKMKLSNGKKASANVDPMSETTVEDCKKLEEEAMAAQEELKQCRAKRRELVEEIRTLTKLIKSLTVKLPQLEMEIAGFDTTREELTNRLPSLREQSTLSASDEKKKGELLEKVERCKSDMASCVETTSKLEKEVSTLQKNIINAGGSKLKNQQKACEKAKKDLNDASKELNAAKSTISTSKKVIAKSEKAKATAEDELERSKAALDQMKEEHEKLTIDAKELLEAYEAVKVVEAEKRKALESVSKESDKIKQEQTKLKCAEVELSAKIENLDKQIKDSERKVAHWRKEIQQLVKLERQEDIDYDLSDDEDEEEDNENMDDGAEETKEEEDAMAEDVEEANDDVVEDIKAEPGADEPKKKNKMSSSLPTLSDASLEQYNIESIKNDIAVLEKERDTLAKNANMGAIAEYRKKEADYLSRVSDLDQITAERNEARKAHDDLKRLRLEKFMNGFSQITLKLKEMYQMITLGGDAELELVDSLDPFSEGIVFSVRPPKKSWKNIANLSGGEKTLSSLALVFALHHYKPTPLYVMDEIDAALDFKNVSIVAHYIKERTKNAQFIIISLRNNMFELADRLVGIYKTNNCTKSVTINPKLYSKNGKANVNDATATPPTPLIDRTNASIALTPVA